MAIEKIHENNKASNLLARIGRGHADNEFAREVVKAVKAVENTSKKAEITLKVTIELRGDGGLEMTPAVTSKLPALPMPSTTMHQGPDGEMLTQQEFLLGGGEDEGSRAGGIAQTRDDEAPLAEAPKDAPLADGDDKDLFD